MAVRVQPRQLAFALPHAESLTRDNFLEGPANEAGLALVERWPDWPNRIMLLLGPEGSGKKRTHWCRQSPWLNPATALRNASTRPLLRLLFQHIVDVSIDPSIPSRLAVSRKFACIIN